MSVNKFAATCATCGQEVPAKGGNLERRGRRWIVRHPACAAAGRPQVYTVTLSSGHSFTRNTRGLCEDAPCCGCCTV